MSEASDRGAASDPGAQRPPGPVESRDVTAWRRIKEHKIIQWALAYLGAALALAHGGELLSHVYDWPEIAQRVLVSTLIVGFPLALLLAWYHGHKGLTHVSEGELMLAAILLVIGAGLLVGFVREPERASAPLHAGEEELRARRPGAGTSTKPRIAILPFENLSPDPANAFFTDGMHEEILTALSTNAPGLEVVSRTTMMTFKGKPVTAQEIARELGATHVLEGSVRRQGDHVRVTLQLIDGATDNHVWSKDYDRTLKDALTLQAAIATEVTDQLSVTMLAAAERAKPPTSAKAYDLYLKAALGYLELGAYTELARFRAVDDLLQQALALDPNFALAHLLRANVRNLLFISNYDVSEEDVKLWRAELDSARRLAPEDPRVLSGVSQYVSRIDHAPQVALAIFDRVEAKGLADPGTLSQKSALLMSMGRLDEAAAVAQRAFEVDSKSLIRAVEPIQSLWLAHKSNEAWHLIATGPSRVTPLLPVAKFYFTGVLEPGNAFVPTLSRPNVPADQNAPIDTFIEFARYSGHARDTKTLLDAATADSFRVAAFQIIFATSGVGRRPIAELRGWADLLVGDKAGLAMQSKPIRDFVAKTRETPWNRWFRRMLMADASLFDGDKATAISAAREALMEIPCGLDQVLCLYPQYLGAQVLAWAGEADGATEILERISLDTPGIAPAIAARDPLLTVPLANSARYKTLKAKLEARMAATKLE